MTAKQWPAMLLYNFGDKVQIANVNDDKFRKLIGYIDDYTIGTFGVTYFVYIPSLDQSWPFKPSELNRL